MGSFTVSECDDATATSTVWAMGSFTVSECDDATATSTVRPTGSFTVSSGDKATATSAGGAGVAGSAGELFDRGMFSAGVPPGDDRGFGGKTAPSGESLMGRFAFG